MDLILVPLQVSIDQIILRLLARSAEVQQHLIAISAKLQQRQKRLMGF
jgi:hypothetical protein